MIRGIDVQATAISHGEVGRTQPSSAEAGAAEQGMTENGGFLHPFRHAGAAEELINAGAILILSAEVSNQRKPGWNATG